MKFGQIEVVFSCSGMGALDYRLHMHRKRNSKECVASLIELYKNNGAVSCVGNYFHFI